MLKSFPKALQNNHQILDWTRGESLLLWAARRSGQHDVIRHSSFMHICIRALWVVGTGTNCLYEPHTSILNSSQRTMKLYSRMQRCPFKNTHYCQGSSWKGSRGEQRNEETPEIQNTYCNSTHTENINVLTIQHTHKTRVKYTNHFQWKIFNTLTLIIWQKRTKTHLVMAMRLQLVYVTLEHTFLHVFVSVQNSKI